MTETTRRTLLGGAIASVAVVAATSTRAQQGRAVFLDYDQQALDRAYDQAPWAPNMAEVRRRREQKGRLVRASLGDPRRFSYGPSEIEGLDMYRADVANAPINVFIHGGTWRFGSAAGTADLAELHVDAGIHFAAVDFTSVTETNGDLLTLADQVRRAIAWVFENARSFGGDPDRLYVSGHSSGGHLAGVAVTTDWSDSFGLPGNLIKGATLISGMYDLYPVSLSARREFVNFTEQTIEALSPLRNIDKLTAPVTVAFGTEETPEFQRQGREFAAAIAEAGKTVTLLVADGYNHFEIAEDMGNPYGVIGRSVLAQIRAG